MQGLLQSRKENRRGSLQRKPSRLASNGSIFFYCDVESFMQVKPLDASMELETMPFTDIDTVLKIYLQTRKGLVIAEQKKFVVITQKNGVSSGDFLARLRKTAWFCKFREL